MSKHTPKQCECDLPEQSTDQKILEKIFNCVCCKHQKRMGAWRAEWCQPCILSQFPLHMWGVWQLLEKCLRAQSAGFSVLWEIDIDKFKFWTQKYDIPDDPELLEMLELMLLEFQSGNQDIALNDDELEYIKDTHKFMKKAGFM